MTATMTIDTTKVLAADLKIGDVILPPAREMRLWMRKCLAEEGRPESDLHITITSIEQGNPDKNGAWLIVRGSGAFLSVGGWKIKMRPETRWPVVERAANRQPATPYTADIARVLNVLGVGTTDPILVEAWMRVDHPTLDALSHRDFMAAVKEGFQSLVIAGETESRKLAESFGLGR